MNLNIGMLDTLSGINANTSVKPFTASVQEMPGPQTIRSTLPEVHEQLLEVQMVWRTSAEMVAQLTPVVEDLWVESVHPYERCSQDAFGMAQVACPEVAANVCWPESSKANNILRLYERNTLKEFLSSVKHVLLNKCKNLILL